MGNNIAYERDPLARLAEAIERLFQSPSPLSLPKTSSVVQKSIEDDANYQDDVNHLDDSNHADDTMTSEEIKSFIQIDVPADGCCFLHSIILGLNEIYKCKMTLESFRTMAQLRYTRDDSVSALIVQETGYLGDSLLYSQLNADDEVEQFLQYGTKPIAFRPEAWHRVLEKMDICVKIFCQGEKYMGVKVGGGNLVVYVLRIGVHYNAMIPQYYNLIY